MPATAWPPAMTASLRHAHFTLLDVVRRAQGQALGALGFDPHELPYEVAAGGRHFRLRDYGPAGREECLLIVAAPIKRPYIWDLAPEVSAIRYCIEHGLRVGLVEWIAPEPGDAAVGFDECADAISRCAARCAATSGGKRPVLAGHSLGGTLAAIFAAGEPQAIRGLVLLGAPLCFQPQTSRFRDALVAMIPPDMAQSGNVPGSVLSHASAMASPHTFVWSRLLDAANSLGDRRAFDIHARVERWALDEAPLPAKLVHDLVEGLYRDNRFCRGVLTVNGRTIGPSCLDVPLLAVVTAGDEVAPLASIGPLLEAMPRRDAMLIDYPGETGVALQHLGILVGAKAFAGVWPDIIGWIAARE